VLWLALVVAADYGRLPRSCGGDCVTKKTKAAMRTHPISMRSNNASNFSCGVGNLSEKSTAPNMNRARLSQFRMRID
jgi:hypothetical protein